jgi:transposase
MKKRVLVAHLSLDQLLDRIRRESNARVLKRLYFICYLMQGDTLTNATKRVGVTRSLGYMWLDRWNRDGPGGLVPKFAGGRPAKLSREDKKQLVGFLRRRNDWTLQEIKELIHRKLGVDYSESRLRDVLKSLGVRHAKPFSRDYRRPFDAELVLKKE